MMEPAWNTFTDRTIWSQSHYVRGCFFSLCGYITWRLVFIMQPPAEPSHTPLSKSVCSDIGPLRRRLRNPAWFYENKLVCVHVCVYVCARVWDLEQWMAALSVSNYACCLCFRRASAHCLRPLESRRSLLSLHPPCISVCIRHRQKWAIKWNSSHWRIFVNHTTL